MSTIKHWIKMLLRQWPRKLLLLVFFVIVVFTLVRFLDLPVDSSPKSNSIEQVATKRRDDTVVIDEDDFPTGRRKDGAGLLNTLSQFRSCPACFGHDFCYELKDGSLKLTKDSSPVADSHGRLQTEGILRNNEKVIISTATAEEWTRFDEYVCRNASHPMPCDIAAAVVEGALGRDSTLEISNLQNIQWSLGKSHSNVVFPLCATPRLVDELIKPFDEDGDGKFNPKEQAQFFTSLLLYPGYVLLKFHATVNANMPFPNLRGACGRAVITDGGLAPLKDYLHEPFEVRAGLAVQVLQMVEDFQDEDLRWYFLATEFTMDNLAVNREGEVILVDLDDIVIIDKAGFPPASKSLQGQTGELCNEVCFQRFTAGVLHGENATLACSKVTHYGQLMFALACKQLLSNLDEHRADGFFNFDGHKIHKKSEYPGLLHSIPEKDRETVEDLMRECVQETTAGGRKQAIEELREILEGYLNHEDEQEGNDKASHRDKTLDEDYGDPDDEGENRAENY